MARLLLQTVEGPRTIELCAFNSLGRHPNNTIQVLDRIASKEHCVIELRDGRFVLRDHGSMNGTYVNGERANGPVTLSDGDEISLGSTRAIFHAGAAPEISSAAEPRVGELPNERILVHLATDKPCYRPGEVLYARAAVLDAETCAPATPSNLAFEIRDAGGDVLVSRLSHAAAGVAPFSWMLPADLEDGEHVLFARCPTETFPPAQLGFSVRAERSSTLCTELELSRSVYTAGDEVLAALWAGPEEGLGSAGARAIAAATLDGEEIAREELILDGEGRAWLRFRLPAKIERGVGEVSLYVNDGEREAGASCAIPLADTRLLLSLHPEGGDLVLGLPARLYIEARTPAGDPAEVAGRIVDNAGGVLAHFHTEHEGRGRVMIIPAKAGRAYAAVLDEPAGVLERVPLPDVAREGLSLIALDDRSEADEPLHFRLASTSATRVRLAIHRREHEVGAMAFELGACEVKDVNLKLPASATGVLRVTLHDALGRPRAERLIFRRPPGALRVEIEALPARPGTRAPMAVRVRTTARGKPVPATLMLAVVDDARLPRLPRRARPPRLPEQVLLGTEVSELGDPAAYLEEGNASARRLDLLLGVQGWRRFAFYDLARFLGEQGDRAERVLARRKPPVVAVTQAVALLPEMGPVATARGPEALLSAGDASPAASSPGQGAVWQRVPSVQHRAGAGASSEGQPLPPFPGPPLPMAVPSAQKIPVSGMRVRQQASGTAPPPVGKMLTVREFAHRAGSAEAPGQAPVVSTLYWSSGITTSVNGEVTVEFDLPDTTTALWARADAFSALGALGSGEALLDLPRAFTLEPRVPTEVCAGDVIDVPLTLSNATPERLDGRLLVQVEGPLIVGREPISFSIAPEGRERVLVPAAAISGRGSATLHFQASAGGHTAGFAQRIGIVPAGFPVEIAAAGRLEADGTASHRLLVPEAVEPGSLLTELRLHPGALSMLSSSLEALLEEPSLGLPSLLPRADLAVSLLLQIEAGPGGDPVLLRRAKHCLDEASRALAAHESCPDLDEQAGDPVLQAALGLRLLVRMAAVFPVPVERLDRARQAVLARRTADPGSAGLGAVESAAREAILLGCLAEAGLPPGEAERTHLYEAALTAADASLSALVGNLFLDVRDDRAADLAVQLAARQEADGAVRGPGKVDELDPSAPSRAIEATALAVLLWSRNGDAARAVAAVDWLLARSHGGRFGSAAATALVARALVAWEEAFPVAPRAGTVTLSIDGELVTTRAFSAEQASAIVLPSFADALRPGERRVELRMSGGAPLPYALRLRYHARAPLPAAAGALSLAQELSADEVPEGAPVDLVVTLENRSDHATTGLTAILGLPAGLELQVEALDGLRARGVIERGALHGRELVLCLPELASRARRSFTVHLLGAIPGTYRGPASRLYPGAADDRATWAAPLGVRVLVAR